MTYSDDKTHPAAKEPDVKTFAGSHRRTRAKADIMLESMTDAVFVSDVDGNFIDYNTAFATFHKYIDKADCPKSLAQLQAIMELYAEDGTLAPFENRPVPRALQGVAATNVEYILRRKDTGQTWVGSFSYGPLRETDGTIVGSVVTARDITEIKRTENALREAESQRHDFFRRTILLATGGKLEISETGRMHALRGKRVGRWILTTEKEYSTLVGQASELGRIHGLSDERLYDFKTCVGEALSNALTHTGGGEATCYKTSNALTYIVSDKGAGIPYINLPEVALVAGYSTAGTAGLGYKLLIACADKVHLSTGPSGTTIAVEMNLPQL